MPITKDQIIAAMQAAAQTLGHTPTTTEFTRLSGINDRNASRLFKTYLGAVKAAGLEPHKKGQRLSTAVLLEDWGQVVRKMGYIPTRKEYLREGNHGIISFWNRFHSWAKVPIAFCAFAESRKLAGEWADVLDTIRYGPPLARGGSRWLRRWRAAMQAAARNRQSGSIPAGLEQTPAAVDKSQAGLEQNVVEPNVVGQNGFEQNGFRQNVFNQDVFNQGVFRQNLGMELAVPAGRTPMLPEPLLKRRCVTRTMLTVFVAELAPSALPWISGGGLQRRVRTDRPVLGAPTRIPGLAHEPVNEMGVVLLFGMLAQKLGFIVEAVQSSFPDCEAKWEVEPGRWQRIRIEFEYESRNFKDHGHDPKGCDLLVCWRHNWKNAPAELEILELSSLLHFA